MDAELTGGVAALAIVTALLVDRAFGEPPSWAHPVVAMGRYLSALGARLLPLAPAAACVGGALAWLAGAGLVAALAWGAQAALLGLPALPAALLLGLLLKPLLAWRVLRDEVAAVERALGDGVAAGRAQVARLVSREVERLDATEVREAAISTLAENLNDSVVAPLLWFVLLGLPGAALYRFANTADAMWGYRGRWEWAGKWAAHADDLLSWLPARITAGLLMLAARAVPGWRALRGDACRTPSPNGGWPMGTMAALLGVTLRKPGVYTLHERGRAAAPGDTARALAWSARATAGAGVLALLAALARWPA